MKGRISREDHRLGFQEISCFASVKIIVTGNVSDIGKAERSGRTHLHFSSALTYLRNLF